MQKQTWGKLPDGREAELFTICSPSGAKLKLTNFGAHIVAIEVPDRTGKIENVVLGLDSLDGYVNQTVSFVRNGGTLRQPNCRRQIHAEWRRASLADQQPAQQSARWSRRI